MLKGAGIRQLIVAALGLAVMTATSSMTLHSARPAQASRGSRTITVTDDALTFRPRSTPTPEPSPGPTDVGVPPETAPPAGNPAPAAPAPTSGLCPAGLQLLSDGSSCYTPGPDVPLPGPIAGASMQYYDFGGSSADAVNNALRTVGPPCSGDSAGQPGCPAETRFTLNQIRATQNQSGGSCTLSNVVIDYSQVVVVPRWTPSAGTPPELYGSWKRWLTGTYTHEAGHVAINTRAMDGLKASLTGAKCGDIETIHDQAMSQLAQAQHQYHLDTNFGRNQGPTFP